MTWYDGGPPPDPRDDPASRAAAGTGTSRLRAAARGASALAPAAGGWAAPAEPDRAVHGGDGGVRVAQERAGRAVHR
ncbi:hypothetical protein MHY85_21155, partial [Cellulomonas sp. ACRRI]|nr:hypothetical protein [Cellulomonas sp. ACRRI]